MKQLLMIAALMFAAILVAVLPLQAARLVNTPAKATSQPAAASPIARPMQPPTVTAQPSAAQPATGEQIKWQVIGGGGGKGTSASYVLSGTVGQTAAGLATSTNYKLNQGYWQNFTTTTGCCVNKRGNVDGDASDKVNLVDLSSLINFLTGGPFVPPCKEEADLNADTKINLVDLSSLINYLTGGPFVPAACP